MSPDLQEGGFLWDCILESLWVFLQHSIWSSNVIQSGIEVTISMCIDSHVFYGLCIIFETNCLMWKATDFCQICFRLIWRVMYLQITGQTAESRTDGCCCCEYPFLLALLCSWNLSANKKLESYLIFIVVYTLVGWKADVERFWCHTLLLVIITFSCTYRGYMLGVMVWHVKRMRALVMSCPISNL